MWMRCVLARPIAFSARLLVARHAFHDSPRRVNAALHDSGDDWLAGSGEHTSSPRVHVPPRQPLSTARAEVVAAAAQDDARTTAPATSSENAPLELQRLLATVAAAVARHAGGARSVPVRALAAQLSDADHETISATHPQGLLSLLRERGALARLAVTQDCAGVWRVECTAADVAERFEGSDTAIDTDAARIERYDAEANYTAAAAVPSAYATATVDHTKQAWQAQQLTARATEIFTALRPHLPSAFFIPLTALAASLPAALHDSLLPERDASRPQFLFAALARMRPQEVDVRVFGDGSYANILVRAVCDNLPHDAALDSGDARHARFDFAPLAGALYAALRGKGRVSVAALPSLLAPDLLFRLPLRHYQAILIFERMPHLFYSSSDRYLIEARDLADESAARVVTSLLVRTSPCPTELRFVVDNLTQPCALHIVERELPRAMRDRIRCFFASMHDFVAAHSAYLFLDGDNDAFPVLCSHRLLQAAADREALRQEGGDAGGGSGQANATNRYREQRRAAAEIAAYLPHGSGLPVHLLRRRLPSELDAHIYNRHPRNFFDMFPDLFTTFVLFHCPTVVYVQHAAFPRPVNAIPRVRTDADCVRVAALLTLTPRRLDIVQSFLPPEGRELVERVGGLLPFIQGKYARFFALFRDRFTGDASAVYVGHLPEEQRESVRRRMIGTSSAPPARRV